MTAIQQALADDLKVILEGPEFSARPFHNTQMSAARMDSSSAGLTSDGSKCFPGYCITKVSSCETAEANAEFVLKTLQQKPVNDLY
ncbi:MAG: hypothetical protein MZV64_18505 [Ignavibacteriales bacterium]|nr:hypothetical protein [Ignavibacteriales bacterium]